MFLTRYLWMGDFFLKLLSTYGAKTKYPVVIKKNGTAILPTQYVIRKSMPSFQTDNGDV